MAPLSVPSVWGATNTSMPNAQSQNFGTERRPAYTGTIVGGSSCSTASPSVSTSRPWQDVQIPPTCPATYAQDVEPRAMVPSSVLRHRRTNPLTPYKPDVWHRQLDRFGLVKRYPDLCLSIIQGFDVRIPNISKTYAPHNSSIITKYPEVYEEIVEKEFKKGRYLGPFLRSELEALIGPFQSLPLSLVTKPGKPGKYPTVHDFSHPRSSNMNPVPSINSAINSHHFPCTWGTFSTVCLIIYCSPPGSQASIRDVAEAYKTIPIHHNQWPGLVMQLQGEDSFAANTNNSFGLASAGGAHGLLADAGADILRANGIGPLSKWVDDHIFFRLPQQHLEAYNSQHHIWSQTISKHGGRTHEGSRIWYRGDTMPDGCSEEYDEDMVFPLHDFSNTSTCSPTDVFYTYADTDIDLISEELSIPWESSKTIPFATVVPYLGFLWDLDTHTVAIPTEKKARYLSAIEEWHKKCTHTLDEVQGLYDKLLHASLVIPAGRAYLTTLETMLSGLNNRPFMPHTPPCTTASDLQWWMTLLKSPNLSRAIPGPVPLTDLHTFSDASSGFSIGITIGDKWRTWHLLPGWKSDRQDIGWAEAVGFELLTLAIIPSSNSGTHFKVYGDNKGVVEGWWKGCSQNKQTNAVFHRIHTFLRTQQCSVHTRYVPSKDNLADEPSCGIYLPSTYIMPYIPIPPELHGLITDFNAKFPITSTDQHLPPSALSKPQCTLSDDECAPVNAELDCQGEEFFTGSFN